MYIPKHRIHHATISSIEAVYTTFIQKKTYVNETYSNECKMLEPNRSRQQQHKIKALKVNKKNHSETNKLTLRVSHREPKHISNGYEIYQSTQIRQNTSNKLSILSILQPKSIEPIQSKTTKGTNPRTKPIKHKTPTTSHKNKKTRLKT